jgi:hypothetical protein
MRFYLSRFLYKKPQSDDYISLDRIEDLFLGFKPMLSYLVEDLVFKGKLNEAKGVCIRHNLMDYIRDATRETLIDVVHNPALDATHFAPCCAGCPLRRPWWRSCNTPTPGLVRPERAIM